MAFRVGFLIGVCCIFIHTSDGIRVDYGTNKGPIEPPTSTQKAEIRVPRHNPAPVFEQRSNDVPNPRPYLPYTPFQYRNKVRASFEKAPASIYFGSDYDRKYTKQLPYQTLRKIAKYNALAKHNEAQKTGTISQRSLDSASTEANVQVIPQATTGVNYRGPQTFGPDHFGPKRTVEFFGNLRPQGNLDRRIVPEFGVLYSAGVRYYIPRLDDLTGYDDNNSVYDREDLKH